MLKALICLFTVFALVGCGSQTEISKIKTSNNFHKSFMPENDLWREADFVGDNGMTEAMFNEIIDSVEKVYSPIVKELGGNLVIERNYSDSTVNAYASQDGTTWTVAMFGGLAKRPEVTHDGFAMVIAHEVGHHVGGWPYVQDWASNEGNSDYFATLAAARNLWKNNTETVSDVDPIAKKLCDDNLAGQDTNLCYRTMNAGYSLANLLGALGNTKVSFKTPDKTIVKKTNNKHPAAQCRLDTYVSGSLCTVTWNDGVIPTTEKEAKKQSCFNTNETGYAIQARPRCWFKPTN